MPIFEYRCAKCDHLEEVLQKHTDPAPKICPACGKKNTLHKELSVTSFQLKGGGWYKDLYASTPAKKDDGGAAAEPSASSSAGEGKSDGASAKPAESAAPKAADKAEKPAEKKAEKKPEKAAPEKKPKAAA